MKLQVASDVDWGAGNSAYWLRSKHFIKSWHDEGENDLILFDGTLTAGGAFGEDFHEEDFEGVRPAIWITVDESMVEFKIEYLTPKYKLGESAYDQNGWLK